MVLLGRRSSGLGVATCLGERHAPLDASQKPLCLFTATARRMGQVGMKLGQDFTVSGCSSFLKIELIDKSLKLGSKAIFFQRGRSIGRELDDVETANSLRGKKVICIYSR